MHAHAHAPTHPSQVATADAYESVLSAGGISLDHEQRRHAIWAQVKAAAAALGGVVPESEGLLAEVGRCVQCAAHCAWALHRLCVGLLQPCAPRLRLRTRERACTKPCR